MTLTGNATLRSVTITKMSLRETKNCFDLRVNMYAQFSNLEFINEI